MKFLSARTVSYLIICSSGISRNTCNAFSPLSNRIGFNLLRPHSYRHNSSQSVRMMSSSPVEFAKEEIASANVVVFSKSFCPFCKKTKKLFSELKVETKVIELDEMDNGADIQAALVEISGQKTVPNVFVKGNHLGGNDDTQAAARNGELQKMLGI